MAIAEELGVSRETFDRLARFVELLQQWSPRINLVARSTLADVWQRHIADSIQVFQSADHPVTHWADLGTGGGLPGVVVAIAAMAEGNPARVTLVESDQRKATFLRTALRETSAEAEVIAARIEEIPPLGADVVSARAVAPLPRLLGYAGRHLARGGIGLFPKGRSWKSELQSAQQTWHFSCNPIASRTDSGAAILKIEGLARA